VRLLIRHPNVPACGVCQKFVINYDFLTGAGDGKAKTWQGPNGPQPLERTKDNPPPCGSCPKKGPQYEREFLLSEKNWLTLEFYRQTKATFGRGLSDEEARDEVVRRNFVTLDDLYAAVEQEGTREAVSRGVAAAFSRVK
jgi:hypothetical protein